MASQVYSARFIVAHAGATTTFMCPAGYRAVITCVTAFDSSAVASNSYNLVHVESNATIVWGLISQSIGAPGTKSEAIQLRFVFYEGESIKFFGDGTIDFSCSGYLLRLP
jgi:hypothetical protein